MQAVQLLILCTPDDCKKISPGAIHGRVGKSKKSIGSNGGIHSTSPRFQNIESYLGGQGVVGRRHPVFGNHFRTGGKQMAGEPVLGFGFWQKYQQPRERKSTRLNSSHVAISYAVFCLK